MIREVMIGNKKPHVYLNYLYNLDGTKGEEIVLKARGSNALVALNVLEMYKRTMKVDLEFRLKTDTISREGEDGSIYKVTEVEISWVDSR